METATEQKIVKGTALKAALEQVKVKVEGKITAATPIATSAKVGLVKPGTGLAVDANGVMSVTGDATVNSVEWSAVKNAPLASKSAPGLAQAGTGINVTNGVMSVTLPTKVSDLTNDSKFQTEAQVAATAEAKAKAEVDKVVAGAPEALDTLKEIAEYLNGTEGADAKEGLVQQIAKNSANIATNAGNITTNTSDITKLKSDVADRPTKTQVSTDIATAKGEAIAAASQEIQGLGVDAVKTRLSNVETVTGTIKTNLEARYPNLTASLSVYALKTELDNYVKTTELNDLAMTTTEATNIVNEVFA